MASRRLLKKSINNICSELFIDCFLCKKNKPESNAEKAEAILADIINTQCEFLSRISHTEPGNVKNFYKKLFTDFDKKTEEIYKAIENLD